MSCPLTLHTPLAHRKHMQAGSTAHKRRHAQAHASPLLPCPLTPSCPLPATIAVLLALCDQAWRGPVNNSSGTSATPQRHGPGAPDGSSTWECVHMREAVYSHLFRCLCKRLRSTLMFLGAQHMDSHYKPSTGSSQGEAYAVACT